MRNLGEKFANSGRRRNKVSDVMSYCEDIFSCIRENDLIGVKKIVELGIDVNRAKYPEKNPPLVLACKLEHLEIVKYLVLEGEAKVIGISIYNDSPLYKACETGNLEIVKFLVSQGAKINEVNQFGMTALIRACELEDPEIVKFLVSKKAKINITPIFSDIPTVTAFRYGRVETLKFLLNCGSSKNKFYNEIDNFGVYFESYVTQEQENELLKIVNNL